jgi:hypothetical protein
VNAPLPRRLRSWRFPLGGPLALALLALLPAAASALDLTVDAPREHGGYVYCDVRLREPFEPRVRESLEHGMPATLSVRAELWRRRRGWFDKLESNYEAAVRIRYDVWSEQFRIERPGAEPAFVPSLDAADALLSHPWALPVGRIGQLRPEGVYYVAAQAVLKPLSVEDVKEVEGWLSGEVESQRKAGIGVVTELPRALFDAVRNFAGFGDRRVRTTSMDFSLADLFPSAH